MAGGSTPYLVPFENVIFLTWGCVTFVSEPWRPDYGTVPGCQSLFIAWGETLFFYHRAVRRGYNHRPVARNVLFWPSQSQVWLNDLSRPQEYNLILLILLSRVWDLEPDQYDQCLWGSGPVARRSSWVLKMISTDIQFYTTSQNFGWMSKIDNLDVTSCLLTGAKYRSVMIKQDAS